MGVVRPLTAGLLLAGCASALPVGDADRGLTVAVLRRDPAAHLGRRVVVGGEILATHPRPGRTEIELLSRPLGGDDVPDRTDVSDGRVLVRTAEFLDPAVFARERQITVVGTMAGVDERPVGEVPYRYPVVAAEHIRLWPARAPTRLHPDPYYPFPWWLYGHRLRPSWPPHWPHYWW